MIGLDTERKRDKKKMSKDRLTLSMSVICEKGGWV